MNKLKSDSELRNDCNQTYSAWKLVSSVSVGYDLQVWKGGARIYFLVCRPQFGNKQGTYSRKSCTNIRQKQKHT